MAEIYNEGLVEQLLIDATHFNQPNSKWAFRVT